MNYSENERKLVEDKTLGAVGHAFHPPWVGDSERPEVGLEGQYQAKGRYSLPSPTSVACSKFSISKSSRERLKRPRYLSQRETSVACSSLTLSPIEAMRTMFIIATMTSAMRAIRWMIKWVSHDRHLTPPFHPPSSRLASL